MTGPPLFGNLFLSAGAMKAGTTWLYSVLSRHPNLHFTPEKEIHYFYAKYVDDGILSDQRRLENAVNKYIGRIDPNSANIDRVRYDLHWVAAYLNRPLDDYWYRNLFHFSHRQRYGCDFSNLYALLPAEAWPQISSNCRTLRVLYTMRDPIKRLWSHIKFHLEVTHKLELLDTWRPDEFDDFARKPFIWDNGEYGRAYRRMKMGLAPEQLKVIFFEDIRSGPRDILAGIEDFLELPHHNYADQVVNQRINESVSRPMPDFFPGLFARDFERIIREVEDQGLVVAKSWTRG